MTKQAGETILINNKSYVLQSFPLDQYLQANNINLRFTSTATYRGYVGDWLLKENALYLRKLEWCCQLKKWIGKPIKELSGILIMIPSLTWEFRNYPLYYMIGGEMNFFIANPQSASKTYPWYEGLSPIYHTTAINSLPTRCIPSTIFCLCAGRGFR